MKRTVLFALMMTLLFSGCAGQRQDENEWRSWQEGLARAEEIACTGEITARIGEEQVTFTAEIRRAAGETALTVTAPETIRGVTARTRDGAGALEYDGLILELSALREDALPPCAAGDLLLRGLTGGQLLWTSRSGETRSAAFAGRDGETVTLWRDGTGAPVYAEIARGGSPELSLRLSNWQTKE